MPSHPLVLSYVEDYGVEDVAPFIRSLRSTGYEGDIVLFTSGIQADCRRFLESWGVREIPVFRFDLKWKLSAPNPVRRLLGRALPPFIPDVSINRRLAQYFRVHDWGHSALAQRIVQLLWHCNAGRFLYYQDFLERHPEYTSILLADVRDVVFQQRPFSVPLDADLHVFEEHAALPLGRQPDNANWIRRLYGTTVLESLSEMPIICAGVILGRYEGMLECIRTLSRDITTRYIGWGTDQGLLNYHVRTGTFRNVRVDPYGNGPAMHLGIAPRSSFTVDSDGQVRNLEGAVCSIVHQYDRHADLAKTLPRLGQRPSRTYSVA